MLQNIVALAPPGVAPFELGVLCEVFGIDRSDVGLPAFDFAVVSESAQPVETSVGFTISGLQGLERAAEADLVCVPASSSDREVSQAVIDLLRATVDRRGRVLSVCSGAFTLAAAGLLDGRPCTTHWYHVDELARRHPQARIICDVLYVDDDQVITSAGTAAGRCLSSPSCARNSGRLSKWHRPAHGRCHRTARADRHSSSTLRYLRRPPTLWHRCCCGSSNTSMRSTR